MGFAVESLELITCQVIGDSARLEFAHEWMLRMDEKNLLASVGLWEIADLDRLLAGLGLHVKVQEEPPRKSLESFVRALTPGPMHEIVVFIASDGSCFQTPRREKRPP